MPDKKEPHHGGRPIRGGDTPTIPQTGFNNHIPETAIDALQHEAAGVMHGSIALVLHFKDGNLIRFTTNRECSFVPGKPTTGSGQ